MECCQTDQMQCGCRFNSAGIIFCPLHRSAEALREAVALAREILNEDVGHRPPVEHKELYRNMIKMADDKLAAAEGGAQG